MATDNSQQQQSKGVLEAIVSNEIIDQLDILKKALKENDQLAEEFVLNSCTDELKELDEEILKIERLVHEQKSNVKRERMKNNLISQNLVRDNRIGTQILKSHEMMTKNPQFGQKQATDYMHEIAAEHEKSLNDYRNLVNKLEKMLNKLTENSESSNVISQKELFAHIQRFDEIFGEVAKQVYTVNEETEKLKDLFMAEHKKIYGRFATNPFENEKIKKQNIEAFSNLKGLDAFPSHNAILSISEYLTKQNLQPTTAPTFGSTIGTSLGTGTGFFGTPKTRESRTI